MKNAWARVYAGTRMLAVIVILAGALGSAGVAAAQAPPGGAPARKPGKLEGKIIADKDGKPIPGAVVIARCGTNGEHELITRTDRDGMYEFKNIPANDTNCLVHAAKYLSTQENADAKLEARKKIATAQQQESALADFKALHPTDEKAKTTDKRVKNFSFQRALESLDPQWKAYETRTLNSIPVPGDGSTANASDLRLPERAAGVGEFARAIIGFEQSGASSAPSVQKYFTDLWLSIPAPFLPHAWKDPNFGPRTQLWGDIRVTSTPQQVQSSIGEFAIGFANQFGALKVNEVAQASEFLAGVETRLLDWGVTQSRLLSFDQTTRERFGLYFTAGFGTITPFNPRDTVQVFNNPAPGVEPVFDQQIAALGLTSQLAGKRFVAFASQDRDKFFRQYYAGIRLKTFYYDRDTDEPQRRFPATLDVVFGQNEAVTGGRLHRMVMRIEGFYPLPYSETNFMYLFGTADLILSRAHINNAVILQPATNNPAIPDPTILLISTPQLNRDHYRIGVGMDFLQVISKIKSKNDNKPKP
ncbi:MAG TPA: hypothetical protein VEU31_07635 [Candidatus Acidoferrales bacterium]|nr:hypothetical protein [Candidatus Acidoferrales bacterium]